VSAPQEGLSALIAHECEVRSRIKDHDEQATKGRKRLEAALEAIRHRIGCAKAGLDNARIANALKVLKVRGEYARGGQDRALVIRDAIDWLATGKCAAYCGLDRADYGTKNYDRWAGQRSDHEWGGPAHGSIVFQVGLNDRKRRLTEAETDDAIYFLLNIEAWEAARKVQDAA
jgi:hypothetical protein